MSEEVQKYSPQAMQLSDEVLSSLVLNGDVSKLNQVQKMQYYTELCKRVGVDPATQPFKLLRLQGKEIFYADKGATQQLSQLHSISHEIMKRERIEDVYVVTVRAKDSTGRYTDEDGAVAIGGLSKDNLANALMKATTKAKRRAVLALEGLGMLDETEIETIPNAVTVPVSDITPNMPETKEEVKEVTAKNKKQRSDWYYSFRDALEQAQDEKSVLDTVANIKAHKNDLSESEHKDLQSLYTKTIKRLGLEKK